MGSNYINTKIEDVLSFVLEEIKYLYIQNNLLTTKTAAKSVRLISIFDEMVDKY